MAVCAGAAPVGIGPRPNATRVHVDLHCTAMTSQRWHSITTLPLLVAGLLFLLTYSWQVIGHLDGPALVVSRVIFWGTWGLFAINYVVSLVLAERRGRWFLTHLHELAFVVLPALRPLMLVTVLGVFHRAADRALRGRFIVFATTSAVVVTYMGALSVLDVERRAPGAEITGFGQAIWWAVTTVIGVGELSTVTWAGRAIAVGLMLTGTALVGAITAWLASWLVDKTDDEDDEERERVTRQKVASLHEEVSLLNGQVTELSSEVRDLRGQIDLLVRRSDPGE